MINKFIIEGLDRLGKTTLIDGIRNKLGFYQVIHYSKPVKLEYYTVEDNFKAAAYQYDSFINMFKLLNSDAKIIFDRAHLGESVYSPLYRSYSGDYVFDLEDTYAVADRDDVRLILLTEDFEIARHFVDDGESLGSVEMREEEQSRFIAAFQRSEIADKRCICVTDRALGGFRRKEDILAEALE